MMVLVGCSKETVHIDFPFEVGDVENIEMYHYAVAPVSAEKKIVVAKTDSRSIFDQYEPISELVKYSKLPVEDFSFPFLTPLQT